MSKYHLAAVLHALKSVQLSGQPVEIGSVFEMNLPNGQTLDYLVQLFDLTKTYSKSTGNWIIERRPITRCAT